MLFIFLQLCIILMIHGLTLRTWLISGFFVKTLYLVTIMIVHKIVYIHTPNGSAITLPILGCTICFTFNDKQILI